MIKVEKKIAVVLSADDVKAMARVKRILYQASLMIEDSGVKLTNVDEDMLMALSDAGDTIDQVLHTLKNDKFEWTLSEEIDDNEDNEDCFSWY